MGFLDRFKQAFGVKAENPEPAAEYRDPLEEQMSKEHAARQQSVIDEAMSELERENHAVARQVHSRDGSEKALARSDRHCGDHVDAIFLLHVRVAV